MAGRRREPDEPQSPPPGEETGETGSGEKSSRPGSRGGRASTRADAPPTSSASSTGPDDPFAVVAPPGGFHAPEDGRPRFDSEFDEELVEPPHLFDWTPERAGAIIRAGGYVLHAADRLGHVPGGEELWRATEQDARAAGEPLARILNRYDSARRLAGMVDEAEFAAAMFDYARRNLALRGHLVRAERAQAAPEPRYGEAAFAEMGGEPVDHVDYRSSPFDPQRGGPEDAERFVRGEEDPTQPAPFNPMAPPPGY